MMGDGKLIGWSLS